MPHVMLTGVHTPLPPNPLPPHLQHRPVPVVAGVDLGGDEEVLALDAAAQVGGGGRASFGTRHGS